MSGLGSLFIDLLARTGKFETDIGRAARVAEKRAKEIDRSFSRLGSRISGALGGIAAGFSLKAVIDATVEAERAMAALEVAVKNNAGAAGFTAPQFAEMASELQKLSTFDDEAIMGMQALLLTFKEIGGTELKRAQTAILDLATALGKDLNSAAMLVGRALADPEKGMKQLARSGVILSDEQKKLIKQLVETGRASEAQAKLLEELEKRFGGAAQAARNTLGGALTGLKNAFGDLLEAKGGLPEATEELNELSRLLQDPATVAAADALTSGLVLGFSNAAKFIADTAGAVKFLAESLAAIRFGAASDDIVRLQDELAKLQELRSMEWWHPDFLNRARVFGKNGLIEWYSDEELDKAIAEIQQHIQNYTKNSTAPSLITPTASSGGGPAIAPPPSEEFTKLADKLKEQIALYGKVGKAAEISYAIQSGALEDLSKAEQQQLLALAKRYDAVVKVEDARKKAAEEQKKATEEIKKLTQSLEEQIATFGQGETAVIAYRTAHGDLAKAFSDAGADDGLQRKVADLTAQMDSMDAASIRAARSMSDLGEANAGVIAIMDDSKSRFLDAADGSENLRQRVIELTRELEMMKDAADAAAEAVADFAKENNENAKEGVEDIMKDFEEEVLKTSDVMTVFQEQMARNTQDIIADTLLSGFDQGVDGILKSFGEMIKKLIAQAIAADIAKRLFGDPSVSGDGWIGTAAGWFAGAMGGGIGGGINGARAIGGPVLAGLNYRINEREPEFFRPRVGGEIIPLSKMNMGGGTVINQNFSVRTETGDRVTRRTEQQIAAAASRSIAVASRRNN